jgi:chitodextrinase
VFRSIGHGRLALSALLAAIAALVLAGAAAAGAATGFLTDDTLSSAGTGTLDVAMASNGYAIAGWIERTSGAPVVRASVRPPGGDWSAPETFPVSLDSSNAVSVAIASSGAAAVTWEEVTSPSTFDVAVSTRPAGGTFTRPELLRDGSQSFSPSVGIAADGTVTLVYTANPDTVVRDFPAGGSALAAALQPLAASCSTSFGGGVAVAPSGDAVVPLACSGASFGLRVRGTWTVSTPVADDIHACPSTSTFHTAVMASIDTAGHPVGVLETHVHQPDFSCIGIGGSDSFTEQLVLPLGGVMTPVATPVASGSSFGSFAPFPISAPQAATSSSGIVFAWGTTDMSFRSQAHVRFFALDGSGGSADQPVGSVVAGSVYPRLAAAANGRALLAWAQGSGADARIVAAERAPGTDAFGAPGPVSDAGDSPGFPFLAMDDSGDGLAAWTQGSAPSSVHVRGHDADAPTLSGVTIPASATPGVPAAFSAVPFDVWGPSTTSWTFGDGGAAAGASATHAYASAGTYTATVTATDAVGNVATQSGVVQVLAPSGAGSGVGGDTPTLSAVSLTHRRFRVGRAATPLNGTASSARRRAPVGTTFRFTLDRAASVKIAFAREARGLRSGRRCVKPSRRLRRAGARRCTRLVPIRPALTRAARAGANAAPFSGRLGRRALAPGRYRAVLTATATPSGSVGVPRALRFRVVR